MRIGFPRAKRKIPYKFVVVSIRSGLWESLVFGSDPRENPSCRCGFPKRHRHVPMGYFEPHKFTHYRKLHIEPTLTSFSHKVSNEIINYSMHRVKIYYFRIRIYIKSGRNTFFRRSFSIWEFLRRLKFRFVLAAVSPESSHSHDILTG